MFKVAVGHSEDADTILATKEVLAQCQEILKGEKPTAGLVFASVSYDFPKILNEITKQYPDIQLTGCSSYGEISSHLAVSEDSLALLLIASDDVKIQGGMIDNISDITFPKVYAALEKNLFEKVGKPSLCCLFADGLQGNVSETIEGFQKYFGKTFPIVGGNACDDWEFQKVFQFYGNDVRTGAACFLVFSDPLKSSNVVRHGRQPFDSTEKHIVTKSDKNIVYKIDNMSALDFYKSQIGVLQSYEPYALLVYQEGIDKYLIRSPFRINEEDGSFFFSGDVPENAAVEISKLSSQEDTLKAAETCVKKAISSFPGKKIELALVFSCALRKEILGTETLKEIEIIKKELPKDTPIFGFYTYGEIGPFDPADPSMYHNETIVISLVGE